MTREEFIKRKIKEKGMTLKEYARVISMPYSTLLSMLSGNLGGASLDNVVRICTGLQTNISILQLSANGLSAEDEILVLSDREMKIIERYRDEKNMQEAVDKLLDI